MTRRHPRVLGVDDAPFQKKQAGRVPIVGVVMEGTLLMEGVAVDAFPVDGDGATEWLARWISSLKWYAALQGVVFGGITIAGLGLVDIAALAERLDRPVLSTTRRSPRRSELRRALETAGLEDRIAVLERTPLAIRIQDGLYVARAGCTAEEAATLLRATILRSRVPEPLRIAHLIGAALVRGESRGRV